MVLCPLPLIIVAPVLPFCRFTGEVEFNLTGVCFQLVCVFSESVRLVLVQILLQVRVNVPGPAVLFVAAPMCEARSCHLLLLAYRCPHWGPLQTSQLRQMPNPPTPTHTPGAIILALD